MKTNYAFRPAYHEWHFIDTANPYHVLLAWIDPQDDMCHHFSEETGDVYEEPVPMTTFNEILNLCDQFINDGLRVFENGAINYFGIPEKDFMQLPLSAARIMATALYEHYIAA